jgi:hypothetical protein
MNPPVPIAEETRLPTPNVICAHDAALPYDWRATIVCPDWGDAAGKSDGPPESPSHVRGGGSILGCLHGGRWRPHGSVAACVAGSGR